MMGDEVEDEEDDAEDKRVKQLAEEMAAKSRLVFDQEDKVWSASSLRVTDYKHNSKVIFPPALPLVQESKLKILWGVLLHQHRVDEGVL